MLAEIPVKRSLRMVFILFFVADCLLLTAFLFFPAWIGLKAAFLLYAVGVGILVHRFLSATLVCDPLEGSILYRNQVYRFERVHFSKKRFGNHLLFMVRLRDDKVVRLSLRPYDLASVKEIFSL